MTRSQFINLTTFFMLFVISCGSIQPDTTGQEPISHKLFDDLLSKYVSQDGKVNYIGFNNDSILFKQYLNMLMSNAPNDEKWNKNQKLAYWLNAYNAFTIELILKHYPIESIKDIGSAIQIPFINTPWDIKFIEIRNKTLDLNNIEHSILRKEFDEPRIHFAIVCASISCPNLRPEAYEANRLDEQLRDQAYIFLNDPSKNQLNENHIKISKIFSWFKGDFTKNGSLVDFIAKYSSQQISENAKISHMDYDWSLNE